LKEVVNFLSLQVDFNDMIEGVFGGYFEDALNFTERSMK